MVDEYLGKKYKLVSSENMDEIMNALGVNFITRKLASLSAVFDLRKDGDEYTLTESMTLKTIVVKFKLGEEFPYTSPDGRKTKTVMTIDGDTLTEVQKNLDGSELIVTRQFSADEIKIVLRFGNIVATRSMRAQ